MAMNGARKTGAFALLAVIDDAKTKHGSGVMGRSTPGKSVER